MREEMCERRQWRYNARRGNMSRFPRAQTIVFVCWACWCLLFSLFSPCAQAWRPKRLKWKVVVRSRQVSASRTRRTLHTPGTHRHSTRTLGLAVMRASLNSSSYGPLDFVGQARARRRHHRTLIIGIRADKALQGPGTLHTPSSIVIPADPECCWISLC